MNKTFFTIILLAATILSPGMVSAVVITPPSNNPAGVVTPPNNNPAGVTTPPSNNPAGIVTGSGPQTYYLQNPLDPKFNSVGGLINGFVDIFTYLVILFAVLMIIYVGLRFVMAQGDVAELKARKDQLMWLMIGVAVVIGARLLISVVLNTLQATGVIQPGVITNAKNAISGQ